jgi:LmbE family N-acetylglucosaminyl deacetylase
MVMNILIVVAHPDDEVLGMGGTIVKHSSNGDKISILYLTTGIASRRNPGYSNKSSYNISSKDQSSLDQEIKKLKMDALKSNKILGITDSTFENFPDNELDSIPRLKIIKVIENQIEKTNPDIVYTNHYGDLNIDHKIVYESCLTACRPIHKKNPKLFSFGVISSMEWNYPGSFSPNYFVNISKYMSKKIRAMKAYRNELKKFPHPRSIENIEITGKKWGSFCGKNYAESFEIIRIIDE